MQRKSLAVVLAAGDATRMKSSLTKVLHPVGHRPIIAHVTAAAAAAGVDRIALVVGRDGDRVRDSAAASGIPVVAVEQTERKGTGHAVLMARQAIEAERFDDVIVLYGDTPLINPDSLHAAMAARAAGADMVVLGFEAEDPTGYGRMITDGDELLAIVEDREASDAERALKFCNGGIITMDGQSAVSLLEAIGNDNAKGEYYLTDIVAICRQRGGRVVALKAPEADLMGCNTRVELAEIEAEWQRRRRHEIMLSGVTMLDPSSVYLAHDTKIAPDVIIEPHVWFGPGVTVASGARIHAFSHIEGTEIGNNASIGPFARLRPGARLAEGAKVGNFCEVKKADIGAGAKVNHLTYIGDATIGAGANIGAGTITCNYDGVNKHRTIVGAGAFIGSNTSLVAPVEIGEGAYIGSGTVVTKNVEADALALARTPQRNLPDKAATLRARAEAVKQQRKSSS
ncbi:bifunctional UDP-N-acetylglucosamine diphosphorylase/glucosamine-1-phosphate N-acetyltransferase GlmU [Pseudohoeflea coraliihabitans]|uniref:Bifunctional protein GlmU n=1 Tax=Pseudohoeflea coraliihabitans TaxID=2860393 RepID=A0ABS6WRK6_9HYPH|nr:bifunctional UDP-N-acetylglucosamine diphosphorylase/glucosamine-1-phosphate N-acetyltransferase GlmU [Pseudohoeflea sp. DP4N28-3]MBW3098420.1 bifunctional UDP-N-acetylglucosamine diphosphorylase/glucosamine-1-phosphate N-acetyltransferase GlmU [Pseudohoeflea sp. DP4N28-3]